MTPPDDRPENLTARFEASEAQGIFGAPGLSRLDPIAQFDGYDDLPADFRQEVQRLVNGESASLMLSWRGRLWLFRRAAPSKDRPAPPYGYVVQAVPFGPAGRSAAPSPRWLLPCAAAVALAAGLAGVGLGHWSAPPPRPAPQPAAAAPDLGPLEREARKTREETGMALHELSSRVAELEKSSRLQWRPEGLEQWLPSRWLITVEIRRHPEPAPARPAGGH